MRTEISFALLLTAATLLGGCDSGGNDVAPPGTPTDRPRSDGGGGGGGGIPANTGLPNAPRGGPPTTSPRPATIDLDYLTDGNGASVNYPFVGDDGPRTFGGLGDVDGDGIDDFTFATATRTHVVHGDGSRLAAVLDVAVSGAFRGFVLERSLRLRGVGDVNGDGIDDVAWLTHDAASDAAAARVAFGRADGTLSTFADRPPDGREGFTLVDSARPLDIRSVQAAGDIDGDGIDDVLIGAFAFNGEDYDAPNGWVLYGRDDGFPATVDLARLEPARGLVLSSPLSAEQRAAVNDDIGRGYDARAVGDFDFNGDGIDDIAIGAATFDWIGQRGALRTYVVFGGAPRSRGSVDMRTLDGTDGVIITEPYGPHGANVDAVASLGDINGDGIDDLSVGDDVSARGEAHVIHGRPGGFEATLERTSLPPGAGLTITDTAAPHAPLERLVGVGDIDGDGFDDIGIEYADGAAILYGGTDATMSTVDLAALPAAALSVLDGADDGNLVALGDIDADGRDDLGIGWSARRHDPGITGLGDIDGDGVEDLGIGPSGTASLFLIRVLYGFGPAGFSGVLPDTTGPAPLALVDESYLAALLAAIETAARAPLDHVNTALASGTSLGPVARACLDGSDGVDSASVTRLECTDEPLPFAFDWGGRRFSGTSGGRFARVDVDAEGLRSIRYESYPSRGTEIPDPYHARFTFERGDELVLHGREGVDQQSTDAPRCAIDPETRLATGDPETCAWLIGETTRVLEAIFGAESEVRNLRFEPDE